MDKNYLNIKQSVREVGRKAVRVRLITGVALIGIAFLILFLAGLILAPHLLSLPYARTGFLVSCALAVGYLFYRDVIVPVRPMLSDENAALMIEKRHPELKDMLISTLQLGRDMKDPGQPALFSNELVGQLFRQTEERLRGVRLEDVVDRHGLFRNVKVLAGAVCMSLVIVFLNPGFFGQRVRLLLGPDSGAAVFIEPGVPVIGDITLTYRYPAYTGLKPRTVRGSGGDIRALKGSEVEIVALSSRPVSSADIFKDESIRVPMTLETPSTLKGSLIVLENGTYCLDVLPAGGKLRHRSKPRRIVVEDDAYPETHILSPRADKVVSEGDVVKLEYDAADDFGLKEIRLVVGGGTGTEPSSKVLKVMRRMETEYRDSFNWELSLLKLSPGEKVPYYLEVVDNDAVSGPKVARSGTKYLEVYSAQKRHEDLLSLQDELLKGMIRLLADDLVNRPDVATSIDDLLLQQEILRQRTIDLLVLFDRVLADMENDAFANYAVYYGIQNMRDMVFRLSDDKTKILEEAVRDDSASHVDVDFMRRIQSMQDEEVVELENDVMFLVEFLRKQRLDDVLHQERKIENMQRSLTDLLLDLADGKTDGLDDRATQEMQKLEEMIQSLLEKLAKMSGNWGDEFLNLEALKALEGPDFNKDMQEMRDALAGGDMEAALKAAMSAVNSLEKMLSEMKQHAQEYVDSTYSHTLQEMSELERRLRELEEGEREVAQQTEELKKDIQSRTFKDTDRALSEFFQKQLNRLEAVKDNLSQIEKSFTESPDISEYSQMERDADRLLKKRNQAMRSPYEYGDTAAGGFTDEEYARLSEKLREMNKARNKEPLLDTFDEMSKAMPQIQERLSQLGDMLKGEDLKESLGLARETLQGLKFWDFQVRRDTFESSLMQREEGYPADEEFSEGKFSEGGFSEGGFSEGGVSAGEEFKELSKAAGKMLAEASGLNREIVEDLESLRESFEEMKRRELTAEEKEQFSELARRQDELGDQAQGMADSMEQLAGSNPSIGSEPGEKMAEARTFMDEAEGKLRGEDGPGALMDERESLYRLSEARKGLGKAMDRMSRGMMAGGIPMPKYMLRRRHMLADGTSGFDMGDVEIPSEESYKVPKEFREDILEAMKKGLPRRYSELNKDYYRKLVE